MQEALDPNVGQSEIEELKKELSQKYTLGDIISKNHLMHDLFNILPNKVLGYLSIIF